MGDQGEKDGRSSYRGRGDKVARYADHRALDEESDNRMEMAENAPVGILE